MAGRATARIQREREAEEAQHHIATERAMEEARNRLLAEEAELQAIRARWEAARCDEEKAAAELGLVGKTVGVPAKPTGRGPYSALLCLPVARRDGTTSLSERGRTPAKD